MAVVSPWREPTRSATRKTGTRCPSTSTRVMKTSCTIRSNRVSRTPTPNTCYVWHTAWTANYWRWVGSTALCAWPRRTAKPCCSANQSGGVGIVQVAFNPDSKMVATAYPFTGVKLWDLGRSFQRAMLPGHAAALSSIAFSPNGKSLATIGGDGRLKVWDVRLDLETQMLPVAVNISANLGFSPDGRYLAAMGKTPGRDNQPQIAVQNVETGETMQTLPDEGLVSYTADGGKPSVWNRANNSLQLWDVNTGKSLDSRTSQSGKLQSSDLTAYQSGRPLGRVQQAPARPAGVNGGIGRTVAGQRREFHEVARCFVRDESLVLQPRWEATHLHSV